MRRCWLVWLVCSLWLERGLERMVVRRPCDYYLTWANDSRFFFSFEMFYVDVLLRVVAVGAFHVGFLVQLWHLALDPKK
jgi:hypothetical protein